MTTINPALLLAAAAMACPEHAGQWKRSGDKVIRIAHETRGTPAIVFQISFPEYAFALSKSLETQGWRFKFLDGMYIGWNNANTDWHVLDESSHMRYLKCVSAQTGIELYEPEQVAHE